MLPDTILRLPAVKAATGLSRSTIYERISAGSFPKPIPLGEHAVGWLASEVGAWIQQRILILLVTARYAFARERLEAYQQQGFSARRHFAGLGAWRRAGMLYRKRV